MNKPDPVQQAALMQVFTDRLSGLQAGVIEQVRAAWGHLPGDPVERVEFIAGIIRDMEAVYGPVAVGDAVEFIEGQRSLRGVSGEIVEPDYLSDSTIERMSSKIVTRLDRGDEDLALRALLRDCVNTVLNRARNTVKISAKASGRAWCRVPEEGACAFCLMLATRGAVYASEKTAAIDFKSGGRYHAHCRCTAVEVFEGEGLPARAARIVELSWEWGTSKQEWEEAKASPEFVRRLWETYIRDDPTRETRLGPSLLPAGFKPIYPRPKEYDELPAVTLRAIEVAIFGDVDAKGKPIGGHDYGVGAPGKTEFPPWWNSDDMIHATFRTLEDPQWFDIKGDRRECRREVHGVVMYVSYFPTLDGELKVGHIYPLNGNGVFKNGKNNEEAALKPFDSAVLMIEPEGISGVQ